MSAQAHDERFARLDERFARLEAKLDRVVMLTERLLADPKAVERLRASLRKERAQGAPDEPLVDGGAL
jgi:putative ubiquitin-RnfH superfamily antitoxin RatB of RatAB toxin-antitoxin module